MDTRRITQPRSAKNDVDESRDSAELPFAEVKAKKTSEIGVIETAHRKATGHDFSATRAIPPAPGSWVDDGNLWPGRSEIQEIVQGLCITNFFGAKKLLLLNAHKITHILICANELPGPFPRSFQYLKLEGFTDNTGSDLLAQLDIALPWIDTALQRGGRVLMHCATGSSRSGAVMVAFLLRSQHLTLQEALQFARSARPIIQPNPGFMEQLEAFAAR